MPNYEVKNLLIGPLLIEQLPQVAEHFDATLNASLRAIVRASSELLVGITFELRNKKTDRLPSHTGQSVLWGVPEDYDSPRHLRIADWSASGAAPVSFPINKHVSDDTTIYRAYKILQPVVGVDDLSSIGLSGSFRIASWPHRYRDTFRVQTIIWL
jgi:hypothetical protein